MLNPKQKKRARVIVARECEESRANNAEQIRLFREYLAERFEVVSLRVIVNGRDMACRVLSEGNR